MVPKRTKVIGLDVQNEMTLEQVGAALGATVAGDGSFVVRGVGHPGLAEGEDILALAMDAGSFKALAATRARAAIVEEGQEIDLDRFAGGLIVKRSRLALAQILALFPRPARVSEGVHPTASIDPTAEIGQGASIGAFVAIGPGARIGDGCRIYSHVSIGADAGVGARCWIHMGVRIGDRCHVGEDCVIQPNAVLGGDGFGFVTPEMGSVEAARKTGEVSATNVELVRINSIGNVVVGNNVEIGSGTCIDRGTLGPTRIGNGTKIDNLVQIGHNVTIGDTCLIAGKVGIAGSTKIGSRVVIAGGSGIGDHLTVGDDVIILGMSGVARDVPSREIWGGIPAGSKDEKKLELFSIARLPRLIRDFDQVKRRLAALEKDRV